jgi:hypothetical protein
LCGLCPGQTADVAGINVAIAIQIQPKAAHRVNGDPEVGRATRVIRVVNEPAFARKYLICNLVNRLHIRVRTRIIRLSIEFGLGFGRPIRPRANAR